MSDTVEFGKRVLPESDDDGFEPTMYLRIVGVGERLEQQWRKPELNTWGHVVGWETEWRGVPRI
jgi:hypothetical protein